MGEEIMADGANGATLSWLPSPEMQRAKIAEAMKLEMKQGQVWYVLCSKWWQLWKAHVRYDQREAGADESATPKKNATDTPVETPASSGGGVSPPVTEKANEHRVAELSLEEGAAQALSGVGSPRGAGDTADAELVGPGPIDNRTLGEGRELREGMMEGEDYVLMNNNAYELLETWFSGGPRFKRWVVSLGNGSHTELTVELFPVKFMVYTCLPNGEADTTSLKVQLYSRAKTMRQICADVKSSLNLTPRVDTRLSLKKLEAHPDVSDAAGATEASTSTEGAEEDGWQAIYLEEVSQSLHEVMGDTQTVALLVETKDTSDPGNSRFPRDHILRRWRDNLSEGDLIDARDSDKKWFESRVVEVGVDGDPNKVKMHFLGWAPKWDQVFQRNSEDLQKLHTFTAHWRQDLQVNSKLEVAAMPEGKRKWYEGTVEEVKYEDGKRLLEVSTKELSVASRWYPEESEEICKVNTHINKPEYKGATLTRARSGSGSGSYGFYRSNTKGKPLIRGAVGLSNLGNTCFMNSMLQCLLATESLSTYFRNLHWKREVNQDNPLGMGGKVAEAYAGLNDDAWSGEFSVVVPTTLKKVVSQYAPMFAGHQQHDASELMNFLLDGIHEDLNRVHKKPYMETVDSGGRKDSVVAEESWRRYLMRNDSITVDTCTGLLRSHVTCPECQHSSVTFDPYTSLSLPLPTETDVMVQVLFHPLPYGTRPLKVAFTLEKDSTVRALKTSICERFNGEWGVGGGGGSSRHILLTEDCLALFEVWASRVFKALDDSCPLSDMKSTDDFAVCQLEHPCTDGGVMEAAAAAAAAATAGRPYPIPAAGERSSPVLGGVGTATGSGTGQASSQATGEGQGEERRAERSATAVVGGTASGGDVGKGGSGAVFIDIVLAMHGSALSGRPRRVTCREGVTNAEVHSIIRRHLSRFVPSLKENPPMLSKSAGDMTVEGQVTQEAGISSTSDTDSDYVHVTGTMALDTEGGSESSPFVHIKKAPAVVEEGGGLAGEATDMIVVADEEVWSEPASASLSPRATAAAVVVADGVAVGAGGAPAEVVGGGGRGGTGAAAAVVLDEASGKGAAEGLPYMVVVTDYAGTVTKGDAAEVPINDDVFEVETAKGYGHCKARGGRNDSTTVKVQFREDSGSAIDKEEMDAVDTHDSLTQAQAEHDERQSVPLDKCFEKYTEREQLGQSELWYCSKCKTHRQAHKKLDVYTAPDVLIVVLKRFMSMPGSSLVYRQKLDTYVSFPIQGLDLTSNIKDAGGPVFDEAPPVYDLYAVSEHSGSLRAGHYTAIAQNSENNAWYSFNDSHVSLSRPDQPPSSKPYVLFYKRRKGVLRWAGMGRDHAA